MHYEFALYATALLGLASSANALRWWPSSVKRAVPTTHNFEANNDGSTFVWVLQDTFDGTNFFDQMAFYSGKDPTNGMVNYVNVSAAWDKGLVGYGDNGEVLMKGDNTTWLAEGAYRDSVRVSSYAQYNTGLFILDLNHAPWGCGIWPAFWTLGSGTWPDTGEIDIIEGVHDNEHNQVAWHTKQGCYLNPNASFSGTVVSGDAGNHTDCDGNANDNSGCAITQWSRASYGPYFDLQGGGVFAMKWDENGVSVHSFYRAAIPSDINDGSPTPSGWGVPEAFLSPESCDPIKYFVNHSVIFDITFCGDWAGNSYANTNCPGTCSQRIMDPANFENASWSINSLKVYRKQALNGVVDAAYPVAAYPLAATLLSLAMVLTVAL
ncbi:glycoside hydrolase family 16 protein [Cylindrobasidium torrendii FP15055 ss-10]|uniref:Glycoside hydrolase family 16 protein n=1 Tax=Cylindrobasidium torrendii FP15055 ss-10 TaxID=1314674 RepID=A0A0D7BM43_9AGAR|nr:glycoside hydrolase family 16 protein [Cylindrobasidium torrendii FP15055 ss-10]